MGVLSRNRSPKSVRVTRGGFCKYGRVHVNRGISIGPDRIDPEHAELVFGSHTMVVPVGGNKNNNWRI